MRLRDVLTYNIDFKVMSLYLRRFRVVAKMLISFLMSVRLSVLPFILLVSVYLSVDGFLSKFYIGDFYENLLRISKIC